MGTRRHPVALAHDHGFALAGVATPEPSVWAESFKGWIASGKHGEMGWLEDNTELRLNPQKLIDNTRSVLMVADLYATRADRDDAPAPERHGRIARYAQGRDYHKVMKKRLHALCDALREAHPDEDFRAFVDTAPVLERELAQRAGLGWIGKHTLLIHPNAGSFMLIGGIATTLELTPEPDQRPVTDHCGSCTRCIDACPTDAITPHSVDASRCIAYLTIEHRSPIDPEFHRAIGDWVFGCDICQEVCPHNSAKDSSVLGERLGTRNESYEPRARSFDLFEVLGWDEDARRANVSGTPMTRAKLDMFKRNAMIALWNSGLEGAEDAIDRASAEEGTSDLVRETARAVLGPENERA